LELKEKSLFGVYFVTNSADEIFNECKILTFDNLPCIVYFDSKTKNKPFCRQYDFSSSQKLIFYSRLKIENKCINNIILILNKNFYIEKNMEIRNKVDCNYDELKK
jgi:hypothetical protein